MKKRETVVVEFAKHELPIQDEDIVLRMLQTVEIKRGDKVSKVRIISREFKLPERTLIFEGIASIEPGPKRLVAAQHEMSEQREVISFFECVALNEDTNPNTTEGTEMTKMPPFLTRRITRVRDFREE